MTTRPDPRPDPPPPFRLSLRIPPDARYARTARLAIESFAKLHHVGSYDLGPFLCAVGEAVANAIEHAASADDLEIEVKLDHSKLTGIVKDHGRGMPAIPVNDTPLPQSLTERGRGIPIMQRCSDEFSVESIPGKGTEISVTRFRTSLKERLIFS